MRRIYVLLCWSLGPGQGDMLRWVGMSSCLVRIPHLSKSFNDVRIFSRPKDFPTWALFNQFCSSLSTSISISLRLNSSDLLLALEIFNTEDIFICSPFGSIFFCIWSSDTKKFYVCAHNFSVSFFSCSDMHQSQYLDECQVIGKSSSFIEAFWAFRFL